MSRSTVAFVGIGRMGANMARRLKNRGHNITALYDVNAKTAEDLAQELPSVAVASLAQVTRSADIIITVVSDDAAMRAIYETPGDNLFVEAKGKLFINCATVSPALHVAYEAQAIQLGAHYLEAPMASSVSQAHAGTLYMMLGGHPEVVQHASSVLQDLTAAHKLIGAAGTASQLKALVNMVMNINTAGLAEGLGLAEALGLDLRVVTEVFTQTGANSRVLETDAGDMMQRDHATYFSAAHAAKDSGIALALAREQGLTLPMAAACKQQYDRMIELGLGDLDKSGVSELTFPSRHGKS